MIYFLLIITIIFVIFVYLGIRRKAKINQMIKGTQCVSMALYRHLTPKYINDYGDKAGYMAVAVMNELFLGKPSNPEAGEFLVSNRNRVKSEFLNLKYDENVCLIVSQAIHIYARLAWINGEKEASIIKLHEAVKRLEDAGIYIPGFEQIEPTKFYLSALHFLGETEED